MCSIFLQTKKLSTPVEIVFRMRAELVCVEILRFALQILGFLLWRRHHSEASVSQFPLRSQFFPTTTIIPHIFSN